MAIVIKEIQVKVVVASRHHNINGADEQKLAKLRQSIIGEVKELLRKGKQKREQ